METTLTERLKEIEDKMKFLQDEKAKTIQALNLFIGYSCENITQTRKASGGEPIFKEKVKTALQEKFPNGASANDILKYLNDRWERQIVRSSLSPQLSRLKKEGVITLDNDIWRLAQKDSASPEEEADDGVTALSDQSWSQKPRIRER